MFYTYVIKNDNGKIYIGYTSDISERLKRHNGELPHKQNSFTCRNKQGEWQLVHKEELRTKLMNLRRKRASVV